MTVVNTSRYAVVGCHCESTIGCLVCHQSWAVLGTKLEGRSPKLKCTSCAATRAENLRSPRARRICVKPGSESMYARRFADRYFLGPVLDRFRHRLLLREMV